MDALKHLGESATYEDAWKADEAPAAEAPKGDDMPTAEPEAPKAEAPAADAPAAEPAKSPEAEFAEGFGMELPKSDAPAKKPEPQTFAEAFKMHRAIMLKGGPKTFEWHGKSYGTDLASDKPKAAAAKPAAKAAAPKGGESKPAFNKFAKTGDSKPADYDAYADKRDAAEAPKITKSSAIASDKPAAKPDGSLMRRVAGEADALMADAAKPVGGSYPATKAKAEPAFDDGARFAGTKLR